MIPQVRVHGFRPVPHCSCWSCTRGIPVFARPTRCGSMERHSILVDKATGDLYRGGWNPVYRTDREGD